MRTHVGGGGNLFVKNVAKVRRHKEKGCNVIDPVMPDADAYFYFKLISTGLLRTYQ